ncbi:DUF481 domain-containing protein [Vibrio coralliirubri]|uniref:DUF481 domain-containing protein n=1 Tax=Vibrio coralliirubri TaxID=1516159 RepID=UPI00228331D4|nr:DUF481 domain-containing protein [Vibrio coralliirubri]MCY9861499.1 DUF481 domain-containing protein [Vibrio coralliirubri]
MDFNSERDWVQLVSGEVIFGELEELLDNEISFDSDELGDLVIDIDDVARINSHSSKTIHLLKYGTFSGAFSFDGETIVIGQKMFRRASKTDIVSITRFANNESERWENEIGFGANINSGNNSSKEFTGKMTSLRTEANSRLRMSYLGTVRQDTGGLNSRNHRFVGGYSIYYSTSYFLRPIALDVSQSTPQNIKLQSAFSAQVGYDIHSDIHRKWEVSIGPSWVYTKFDKVHDGIDSSGSSLGVSISSYYEVDLGKDMDLSHTYSLTTNNESAGGVMHHNLLSLSLDLTEVVEMEVDFVWDRTEKPVAKPSGDRPEKDDLRLSFGVGIEF